MLEALRHVVDVVGDATQQLPAGLTVEVAERQAIDLPLDRCTQVQDGCLNDVVEQVSLEELQQRRDQVDSHHEQQDLSNGREVDTLTGNQVDAGQQVGDLSLS